MENRIAAITMARGDQFFLNRWIGYYGAQIGYDNLYVLLDGEDEPIPSAANDQVHIFRYPHPILSRSAGDKYRIARINGLAHNLLENGYRRVIGTDADEFLLVDPKIDTSLYDYLMEYPIVSSISGLGIDLGQRKGGGEDSPLNSHLSLLQQRRFGVLSARYTKASVIATAVRWGSGFHRIKGHNFHIAPDLYLLHTGYCDVDLLLQKSNHSSRLEGNWEAHLGRRSQTIRRTSQETPKAADLLFEKARKMQTWIRPLYALNKPYMISEPVVQLPERFSSIMV